MANSALTLAILLSVGVVVCIFVALRTVSFRRVYLPRHPDRIFDAIDLVRDLTEVVRIATRTNATLMVKLESVRNPTPIGQLPEELVKRDTATAAIHYEFDPDVSFSIRFLSGDFAWANQAGF